MPRKGENIHKRSDGRWEGRYIDFYKPSGKPHYRSVYGGSYSEVKDMLKSEKEKSVDKQKYTLDKTFDDISAEWLESVKIRIKVSSYCRYNTILKNHINVYFKGISPSLITNELIENFIKTKASEKLSAKTIRGIISVLILIIKYAEKRKYTNSFRYDISLPKIQSKKLTVLSPEQQEKLVKYINDNLNKQTLGILIALYTGVRLGELCALKWENIDFETQEIIISSTIQRINDFSINSKFKTKLIIDKPKSEKSVRNIPIPSFLLGALKNFSQNHKENEYILTGTIKPIDPRTYQNKFKEHIRSAGLKHINFHTTRHTFATRAIEAGFDVKSLSEILGHSSVKFTLDRYVHSSQEQKKICMNKMNKFY